MGSAFRKALSFSSESWTPEPEPERPRGGRSPEGAARRRERRKADVRPVPVAPPAQPPPAFPGHVLVDAEGYLPWGSRSTQHAFLVDVTTCLKLSRERAMELVGELVKQGRVERTVRDGFATLKRRRPK